MARTKAGEAVEIGCLSLRLLIAVVILIVGLLAAIVVFPLLLLIFLAIPFMFL